MAVPRNPLSSTDPTKTGPTGGPSAGPSASRASSPFGRPGGDDDFVIDLDGVNLNGNRVGEGVWLAYVSGVVKEQSKSGNPMFTWSFTVYDGPFAGSVSKMYTALTPNALWKLGEVCTAIGYELPETLRFTFGDLKAHALGVFVGLNVTMQDYQGSPSPSLDTVMTPEQWGHEPGTHIPKAGVPTPGK